MKNNHTRTRLYAGVSTATLAVALLYHGCSGSSTGGINLGATAPPNPGTTLAAPFTVSVFGTNGSTKVGTALYTADNSATALTITAGVAYDLVLTCTTGGTYSMKSQNIDVPGAVATTQALSCGDNLINLTPGDYALTITSSASGQAQTFQAAVSCTTPTALVTTGISVAVAQDASGPNNMFDLSISGIAGGAPAVPGQPQYLCGWDYTGSGILDTAYTDCSQGSQNFYDNYVGTHAVQVLIKDSCNNTTPYTSGPLTFNFTVPGTGITAAMTTPPSKTVATNDTFIYGQTWSVTGPMASDARVVETGPNNGYNNGGAGAAPGITYLATNVSAAASVAQVQPMFSQGSSGASFTLTSSTQYSTTTSLSWGVQFQITGITGSIDTTGSTLVGSLDASGATISKVTLSTDQAGDAEPQVTFQGNNSCTFTPNIKVLFEAGTPCTGGTPYGNPNPWSVEMWGPYSCTLKAPDGSMMTFTGILDGVYHSNDGCSGGQEGSTGGINPITS